MIFVGFTYAYFITNISGNTNAKSIEVSTADLKLFYNDGTNDVLTNLYIESGNTIGTKDFIVTNTGESDIDNYAVYIEDLVNEFSRYGDITYELVCNSSDSITCNGKEAGRLFPITNELLVKNSIKSGITHIYTLIVTYNETGVGQSIDMNKKLFGKIKILA